MPADSADAEDAGVLEELADELYRLPLSEFTSNRDARAAEATRAGKRALAGAIKKLRKPTVGAWLANVLAHERPEDVEKLTVLGAAMRSAQGRLAGGDLRRLSRQRQELVQALGDEAARLGRQAGQTVGAPAVVELQETLEAALSDDDAGRALRQGRLTARLQHAGLGLGDVAAAGPEAALAKESRASAGPRSASRRPADGDAPDRLRAAKAGAVEARRQATERRADRQRAEREGERLAARLVELEEELRSARADADRARKVLRTARAEEQAAATAEERAEEELRRLER